MPNPFRRDRSAPLYYVRLIAPLADADPALPAPAVRTVGAVLRERADGRAAVLWDGFGWPIEGVDITGAERSPVPFRD